MDQADDQYLELEDEMEIEEALSKLTRRLESLRDAEKTMSIGSSKFEFNDKDKIFLLVSAIKRQTKTSACVSCHDFVF